MTTIHRFLDSKLTSLGAREFKGIACTDKLCSDGYALVIAGGDLSRLQGGQLAWNHEKPIGRILNTEKAAHQINFSARLAAKSVSDQVDELCALVKSGDLTGVSMSFDVIESEPIDPSRPAAGKRATKWAALEISLCLVGVDPGAKVTSRAKNTILGSSPNEMQAAMQACDRALDAHRAAGRHHQAIAEAADRLSDHRGPLGTALRAYRAAVESGDHETAIECQSRCERHMAGMQRELSAIADRHADAAACHGDMARALRSAAGGSPIQVSDGIATDTAARSLAWRRRQIEILELAQPPLSDDFQRRQREIELMELEIQAFV